MIQACSDFEGLFGEHAALMRAICQRIHALSDVSKIVLFGSYAKRCAECESDIDLAVFFDSSDARLLRQYRELARIRFQLMRMTVQYGAEAVMVRFRAASEPPRLTRSAP